MAPGAAGEELLDRGGHPPDVVRGNLRDMERMVRWLGVPRRLLQFLDSLDLPRDRPITLLDLATGSGWLPRTALEWARDRGVQLEITGLDRNSQVLDVAREFSAGCRGVHWLEADVLAPYPPSKRWDIVTCSMALHHFDPDPATRLLTRMDDTARLGWWVCDLTRSPWVMAGAWLACRVLSRNPLTRHDGPMSARWAYPRRAVLDLLRQAGVGAGGFRRGVGFWVALNRRDVREDVRGRRSPPPKP